MGLGLGLGIGLLVGVGVELHLYLQDLAPEDERVLAEAVRKGYEQALGLHGRHLVRG